MQCSAIQLANACIMCFALLADTSPQLCGAAAAGHCAALTVACLAVLCLACRTWAFSHVYAACSTRVHSHVGLQLLATAQRSPMPVLLCFASLAGHWLAAICMLQLLATAYAPPVVHCVACRTCAGSRMCGCSCLQTARAALPVERRRLAACQKHTMPQERSRKVRVCSDQIMPNHARALGQPL
jgi:hypothetical protein